MVAWQWRTQGMLEIEIFRTPREGCYQRPPEKDLVLISAYDGIGGARRALDLLCVQPRVFISLESDEDCAAVVKRAWEDVVHLSDVADLTEQRLRETAIGK